MSGTPATIHRPPHRLGTTLRAFSLDFAHPATELPKDLTGLTARLLWQDQDGATVADWVLDDDLKPGLACPAPATGRLYVGTGAVDPLPIPARTSLLRGDLRIELDGETFVPIAILQPVFEGVTP
jgi:hypothetical protein